MNAVVQQSQSHTQTQVFRDQFHKMEGELKVALPTHIPVERFMRVVLTAVNSNPDLLKADRRSLFEAAMKSAQDGLLPDARDGAFVMFGNRVQWMPMIGGILKKCRNSGELSSIDAQLVHLNDRFSYRLGIDEVPVHEPDWFGDRGEVVGVYAVAKLKDGSRITEIMSKKQVEEVRAVSRAKSAGPWTQWWGEMARKTVLRRLSKRLPMSTDLDDLIRRDDELYDLKGGDAAGQMARAFTPIANPLSDDEPAQIENHSSETGEIIEAEAGGAAPSSDPSTDEPENDAAKEDGALIEEGRQKAMEGRRVFDPWYAALSAEQMDALKPHMAGLMQAAKHGGAH